MMKVYVIPMGGEPLTLCNIACASPEQFERIDVTCTETWVMLKKRVLLA